jgi:hypothetical protein
MITKIGQKSQVGWASELPLFEMPQWLNHFALPNLKVMFHRGWCDSSVFHSFDFSYFKAVYGKNLVSYLRGSQADNEMRL